MQSSASIEDFWFGIELTITGIVVVFFALVTVALIVFGFQRINRVQEAASSKKTTAATAPQQTEPANPAAEAAEDGKVSPEVAAVIAAAVAAATTKKVRIHRIQYRSHVSSLGAAETSWSRQGRVSIMTSRTPRR